MARKSAYTTVIKPNFATIEELIKAGATEKKCMEVIGVAHNAWAKHKKENKEFSDFLKRVRKEAKEYRKGVSMEKLKNRPKKEDLAEMLTMKASDPSTTAKELINIWKFFYPEDDWYRLNEEGKTAILRHEADTKRLAVENQEKIGEETEQLKDVIIQAIERDFANSLEMDVEEDE